MKSPWGKAVLNPSNRSFSLIDLFHLARAAKNKRVRYLLLYCTVLYSSLFVIQSGRQASCNLLTSGSSPPVSRNVMVCASLKILTTSSRHPERDVLSTPFLCEREAELIFQASGLSVDGNVTFCADFAFAKDLSTWSSVPTFIGKDREPLGLYFSGRNVIEKPFFHMEECRIGPEYVGKHNTHKELQSGKGIFIESLFHSVLYLFVFPLARHVIVLFVLK